MNGVSKLTPKIVNSDTILTPCYGVVPNGTPWNLESNLLYCDLRQVTLLRMPIIIIIFYSFSFWSTECGCMHFAKKVQATEMEEILRQRSPQVVNEQPDVDSHDDRITGSLLRTSPVYKCHPQRQWVNMINLWVVTVYGWIRRRPWWVFQHLANITACPSQSY
jgi:hypothetical protein